jgi:chemotaxis protein histidine kinase CheA
VRKPAPVAAEQPAADVAAEEEVAEAAEQAPSAEDAEEAVPAVNADSAEEAEEADAVDAAKAEPEPAAEAEAEPEPAAETAEFKASAAQAAEVPVPEAVPANAAAAESKAAAALLDAQPAEEAHSRAAETVIPGQGAAGYHPTQVSIPVARVTPSAPAKPAAAPKPAEPTPAQKPGPTFTAAKPAERAAPKFSASPARPSRPATPPPDQPAYGPSGAAQGYPPPQPQGSTTPYPPSGAAYGPPNGHYAGPAQPYPDLAGQYPPGTSGGRAGRGRGQGRRILWLVVAVIVAAAIGVGTALALNNHPGNGSAGSGGFSPTAVPSVADTLTGLKSVDALNNPSTALPAGWTMQTVTAADANSAAAGFRIAVPPGWKETRKNLATEFTGPGNLLLEVDLTQQQTANMVTAAKQLEAETHFRDYKRVNLQAEPVRHAEGAFWKFYWTPAGGVQYTVDDIFFAQQTSAGVQDYAIYLRSPSSTFSGKSLPLFDEILPTFQTVTAS